LETRAVAQERDKKSETDKRLLDIETFDEMSERDSEDERGRELPSAAAAAGERSREPEQCKPERECRETSCIRNRSRDDGAHKIKARGELRRQG
jgi:hypothetical protein